MSILLGFNTAVRALLAQQMGINTTAHNIANSNTPGYSRQDITMATTAPFTTPTANRAGEAGQIGTGVTVTEVRRIRDLFLDSQFRLQNQGLGYWVASNQNLKDIEDIFNEPTDNGLGQTLAQFWNRWRDVTNDPQNPAVRLTLREQAADLAAYIRAGYQQLTEKQEHLDDQMVTNVEQINGLASQIFSLNEQITKVLAIGDQPNDLQDRRDLLLDDLSKIVRISSFQMPSGATAVTIGGVQMVGEGYLNLMTTEVVNGLHEVKWNTDNDGDGSLDDVTLLGGELAAQADLRDTFIPDSIVSLNSLANALASEVNALHKVGFGLNGSTGLNFFTLTAGQEAQTIDLSKEVKDDASNIAAAASTGRPGDSNTAAAIAALQFSLVMDSTGYNATSGNGSIEDFYRGFISTLGATSQGAEREATNQGILVQHVDQGRQSISGTSLDEEATTMIKYQRAYEAAARMITTLDQMLETIINRMGVVGR
jgi:flagellar hook-associated protein 1